ncbi:MAG TPA: cobalamin B12-binding domain-containing protein [Solirubrobacteraceae bacterium]|nr:cobalamin B12-binding domain-containing protein [Solirubrobacteraceae bacterium]
MDSEGLVRIGELSRRLGVGTDRLRAWERRYGLLRPLRTPGGFRLYSREDEQRVREMQAQLARGLSAAQAAEVVVAAWQPTASLAPSDDLRARLAAALAGFDDVEANAVLDRLFAVLGPERVMRDIIYPHLRALGEAWERGEIEVGQEHFASNLLQSRLLGLLAARGIGVGPRAVLACAPGDQHSLGLTGLAVALRNRAWRVTYLGADTPLADVARAVETLTPQLVVLSSTMAHNLTPFEEELRALAASVRLALAGAGVSPALAEAVGAELLEMDPVSAAEHLAG